MVYNPVPLETYQEFETPEMIRRSKEFYAQMNRRRTVRYFSDREAPESVIVDCIRAAGTAPSGANLQPWHFVVVKDMVTKSKIREAAELEEREFYANRAPQEWLDALAPLGTDDQKPFLETAPYLIVIFAQKHGFLPDGRMVKHYYVQESVGIATGILITGLHQAGLVTLTHTPNPMNFLNTLLGRPQHERPFLLLVAGYPANNALVPDIHRKPVDEILTIV